MSFFTSLNTSDGYSVEELNIYNINNKIIEDAFKDTLSFTNSLGLLFKK